MYILNSFPCQHHDELFCEIACIFTLCSKLLGIEIHTHIHISFWSICFLVFSSNTQFASESSDSSGRYSLSFRQDIEPKKEDNGEYGGVSSLELERRLHELLHMKQQERIEELEYALECAKRNLVEKEIEICQLRDHASLASPHKDENPISIKQSTSFAFDHHSCW